MFRKTEPETPAPEPENVIPTVVHCDCQHQNEDARYLDLTQIRDTMFLLGSAYAIKTLIDVLGKVAVIAAQERMTP